jgi:NADPH:quinone reductase-like Zn-dependent oxidoreductase
VLRTEEIEVEEPGEGEVRMRIRAVGINRTDITLRSGRSHAKPPLPWRRATRSERYEHQLIVAEGDYVIVHGRFSGTGRPVSWVAADIVRIENGRLTEHWDVLQDEATKAESKSGLPMFGDASRA